jgi:cyclic pyranopterin phosphate synthase
MLIDGHNRVVDYLRVSVTERCNFRCQYCMPEKPFNWVPHENLLSYDELFSFIKIGIDEGIKKIRITGGEPLLRRELDKFIKMISNYAPNIDLSLTTNAFLLEDCAQTLKNAGLKRLNISLDTLNKSVAHHIAQKDVLQKVLKGIQKADDLGLKIKINCVPLEGINDNELISLLEFCKNKGYEIRFIEYMENTHANVKSGLTSKQIQENISQKFKFQKAPRESSSPSQSYILEDGYKFGIIEPHKDDFCNDCNRIRLTAEGFLIPCLYFEDALSIAEAIKTKDIQGAGKILRKVLINKPQKNKWEDASYSTRAFYETGG